MTKPSLDMAVALVDPAAAFDQPKDVLTYPGLSREQRMALVCLGVFRFAAGVSAGNAGSHQPAHQVSYPAAAGGQRGDR